MNDIAPDIFRKRLIIEGFFTADITERSIVEFFSFLTGELKLKTYGNPIVHATSGQGRDVNQGYDAFVPLIDSGIYLAVWSNQKFLSLIIYTCKDFEEQKALESTVSYFTLKQYVHNLF